uniref:Uncharacterized protein n=1 Tax=Acrobeloides nanus TaxID=290746 RepID=A0A914DCD4_9BILA
VHNGNERKSKAKKLGSCNKQGISIFLDVDDQLTTTDESDPREKDIVDRHSQAEETLEHEPIEYEPMENELPFEADSLVNEPEDYSAFEYLID